MKQGSERDTRSRYADERTIQWVNEFRVLLDKADESVVNAYWAAEYEAVALEEATAYLEERKQRMPKTEAILKVLKKFMEEEDAKEVMDSSNVAEGYETTSAPIMASYGAGGDTGRYLFKGTSGWHITDDPNIEGNCWPATDENLILTIKGGL